MDKLKSTNRNLIIIAVIGIIISFLTSFTNGIDMNRIFYRLGDWGTTLVLALFLNWILSKQNIKTSYLPYILLIPSLYSSINPIFTELLYDTEFLDTYFLFNAFVYYFVNIYVIYKAYKLIIKNQQKPNFINENKQNDSNPTLLDKIIFSIEERVTLASKRIFFSLIAMIVIVIVGSSASFGTVALNEANKIRELESERIKMLTASRQLKNVDNENYQEKLKEIQKLIEDKYGKNNDYKELIGNIEKESYISWPDIAMRITIAALTLFLVQIFFHIYKYNQRQESNLLSRIEVFKLYTDEKAELNQLRNGLVSKINSNVEFEKSPTSPTEQIINIIEKSKGT